MTLQMNIQEKQHNADFGKTTGRIGMPFNMQLFRAKATLFMCDRRRHSKTLMSFKRP